LTAPVAAASTPDELAPGKADKAKPYGLSGKQADGAPGLAQRPGPADAGERARLLGELYGRLAKAKDAGAAKIIETAIERIWLYSGSDTTDLLMSRALKLHNAGKSRLALKILSSVVILAPDYQEGWNRRAYIYFSKRDYRRALRDLKRVLKLDPRHFQALNGMANIMRALGDKASALEAFRKVRKIHPFAEGVEESIKELEREVEGQEI